MTKHIDFRSSGAAYDACNSREEMHTGRIFTVESEGIVGIAWAWPIAITVAEGHLHGIESDPRTWGKLAPRGGVGVPAIALAVDEAIALARTKGWALSPVLRDNV